MIISRLVRILLTFKSVIWFEMKSNLEPEYDWKFKTLLRFASQLLSDLSEFHLRGKKGQNVTHRQSFELSVCINSDQRPVQSL